MKTNKDSGMSDETFFGRKSLSVLLIHFVSNSMVQFTSVVSYIGDQSVVSKNLERLR